MLWALSVSLTFTFALVCIAASFSVLFLIVYALFCFPFFWWFNYHFAPDKRPHSYIRDFRNAFRYYKSLITRKPPVLL